MMRTVETKVYEFYELSEGAQHKAFEEWLNYAEYPYFDEFNETVEQFQEMLNGRVQVSWMDYYIRKISYNSYFDEEVENLSGVRLAKYLWNNYGDLIFRGQYYSSNNNPNRELKMRRSKVRFKYECPLTGCYTDHCLLDPMVEFMRKPRLDVTMIDLLEECFDTFIREMRTNIEEWFCIEVFNDECEANGWEFYENGDRYYS